MTTGNRVILDTNGPTGLLSYKNGDVLTLREKTGENTYAIVGTSLQVHTDWVKPYFNLGDRVRVTGCDCDFAPNGEYTLIVSPFHRDRTQAAGRHGHYCIKCEGRDVYVTDDQIEKVVIPAPKFKIGDKVRISGAPYHNGEFVITAPPRCYDPAPGVSVDKDGDYWSGSSCLGRPNRDGDGRVFELVTEPKKLKNQVVYRIEGREWFIGEKITLNDGSVAVYCEYDDHGADGVDDWFDSKQAAIDSLVKELSR